MTFLRLFQSRRWQSLLLASLSLSMSLQAQADGELPSVDNRFVSVQEMNPTRDAGYVAGDKLERTIVLTVKKPYQLIQESLPIIGYEHRYRGETSGIELVGIKSETKSQRDQAVHTIHLVYQVFKTGRTAKPAILRGEIVKLRNLDKKDIRQFRIPSFNFRTSPLSVLGEVNLKNEMSPLVKPFTLSTAAAERSMKIAIIGLAMSLLGLLYVFGSLTWLPRMGGAFAKAYRKVTKAKEDINGLQQAITDIHQALHQVAGYSVFGNGIEAFIQAHPAYAVAKPEIEQFFQLSRQVFFDPKADPQLGLAPKAWLTQFCRHMRDCERGLRPEVKA